MSEGGKRNAWLTHVKKTMKAHKGMKFGQVLKMAKKTYKMKGGAVQPYDDFGADADILPRAGDLKTPLQDAQPLNGATTLEGAGRRRRSRKTRRSRKY